MEKIGFFTSIPVEVIYAAGHVPVDLNNVFVASPDVHEVLRGAEAAGLPGSCCSWIKGVFETARRLNVRTVVTVGEGECSLGEKLADILKLNGIRCIPFSYPRERREDDMRAALAAFMDAFGVSWDATERAKRTLDPARALLHRLDELAYRRLSVSSTELFMWLLSGTDFQGDPAAYTARLAAFLRDVEARPTGAYGGHARLGVLGIPPIVSDMCSVIEDAGGVAVYQEIPRQFCMPSYRQGLVRQYLDFTYPYAFDVRLQDIRSECERRQVDGVIHYVQSFCPRQLDDTMLRRTLTNTPYLTVECDRPGTLDERNRTRIEAFLERWK